MMKLFVGYHEFEDQDQSRTRLTAYERMAVKSNFELVESTAKKKASLCKLCNKIIRGSPANLKDHLTSKHSEIAKQIGIENKCRDRQYNKRKFNNEIFS